MKLQIKIEFMVTKISVELNLSGMLGFCSAVSNKMNHTPVLGHWQSNPATSNQCFAANQQL